MENFLGILVSVLLALFITTAGILIKIFVTSNKKMAELTEDNSKNILTISKDVISCIKDIESAKRNIYEVREILQRHNDRILRIETKDEARNH